MKEQTKNSLKDVTIGGNYIGGNQINYFEKKESTLKENKSLEKPTIFLSYCRKDAEEANKIEQSLSHYNIEIKRDIRDIKAWKSIREFMKSIRDQDFAILLISDAYLKSYNCMYEALEIMKEKIYEERIFPAVLEQKIYHKIKHASYIQYWEKESRKLESSIQGVELTNAKELIDELNQTKKIANSMGEFLAIVADKNNPEISEVSESIISILKQKGLL